MCPTKTCGTVEENRCQKCEKHLHRNSQQPEGIYFWTASLFSHLQLCEDRVSTKVIKWTSVTEKSSSELVYLPLGFKSDLFHCL